MAMVAVLGRYELHPADADAAAELMETMMKESGKEDGCLQYVYARDLAKPNWFHLSELWENAEVFAAHFQTSHMAEYRQGMSKLKIETRIVKRLDVTGIDDL